MILPVEPGRYVAFLGANALMAAMPGPANLFAVANGMSRGRRAVAPALVGMNLATLIWYVAAAFGLTALAKAYPQAVRVLVVAGSLYLVWLAVSALRDGFGREIQATPHARIHPSRSPLVDAFMVQVANPKVLVFFGAVLPPFLDLWRPLLAQFAVFAATSVTLDALAAGAFGIGGAALAARMDDPGFRRGYAVAAAVVLIGAAALILASNGLLSAHR